MIAPSPHYLHCTPWLPALQPDGAGSEAHEASSMHVSSCAGPQTEGQKAATSITTLTAITCACGQAGKGPKPQKRHACPTPPALHPMPA